MFPITKHYQLKGWYKKWHIEKDFQAEITKYLRNEWYICYHITDIWLWNKFLDMIWVSPDWVPFYIEFKKIEKDSFNVKNFEDSQVILLRELEKRNPELARVWIYSKKHNEYKVFKFSELWDNRNKKWGIKLWGKWDLIYKNE